jgi:hypothetical protein
MADLSTDARNRLQSSSFGLPGSRRFPMPDKTHAANAKARATQGVKAGTLSPSSAAKVRAKANRVLGKKGPGGVTEDINAPGNRAPSPAQDDINNWKSKPVARGPKVKPDSQGNGSSAIGTGKGQSYKGQAKHGGTEAAGASKKGQAKVSSGTTQAPSVRNLKSQPKYGGTANSGTAGNGKRYSNGSSSFNSMQHVIRDH